jgi:hypothetical protein
MVYKLEITRVNLSNLLFYIQKQPDCPYKPEKTNRTKVNHLLAGYFRGVFNGNLQKIEKISFNFEIS